MCNLQVEKYFSCLEITKPVLIPGVSDTAFLPKPQALRYTQAVFHKHFLTNVQTPTSNTANAILEGLQISKSQVEVLIMWLEGKGGSHRSDNFCVFFIHFFAFVFTCFPLFSLAFKTTCLGLVYTVSCLL